MGEALFQCDPAFYSVAAEAERTLLPMPGWNDRGSWRCSPVSGAVPMQMRSLVWRAASE
jgi:hypothetical protein